MSTTPSRLPFDAILFDFDGTITQSGDGITRSVAYAYEKLGLPVPDAQTLRQYIGPRLVNAFRELAGLSEQDATKATELFRERYHSVGWRENRVYAGIAPLLRELKAQGCYLAIASSKPQLLIERICEHFGLGKYFDCIRGVAMNNTDSTKDAQIQSALPEGCDRARTAMVGDRRFDMLAAKRTGLFAIGALYGYGTREELCNAGADMLCEDVSALRAALLPGVKPARGRMISFEGTDGCGKSTQMRLAAAYLGERGYELLVTREPGGSAPAEEIRSLVLDVRYKGMSAECEALLYAAARAEHVRNDILPALEAGKLVLCDRFMDSSLAYQAHGRELGEDFIRLINKVAAEVQVDRTLLFAGDTHRILDRLRAGGHPDRIEIESNAFFEKVNRAFLDICAAEPERVKLMNSDRSIEQVFEDVKRELDELLENPS